MFLILGGVVDRNGPVIVVVTSSVVGSGFVRLVS